MEMITKESTLMPHSDEISYIKACLYLLSMVVAETQKQVSWANKLAADKTNYFLSPKNTTKIELLILRNHRAYRKPFLELSAR